MRREKKRRREGEKERKKGDQGIKLLKSQSPHASWWLTPQVVASVEQHTNKPQVLSANVDKTWSKWSHQKPALFHSNTELSVVLAGCPVCALLTCWSLPDSDLHMVFGYWLHGLLVIICPAALCLSILYKGVKSWPGACAGPLIQIGWMIREVTREPLLRWMFLIDIKNFFHALIEACHSPSRAGTNFGAIFIVYNYLEGGAYPPQHSGLPKTH